MESGRPPRWRLAIVVAGLALAAGAYGALALPQLAVVAPPREWRAASAEPTAPSPKPSGCRKKPRTLPRAFDHAR